MAAYKPPESVRKHVQADIEKAEDGAFRFTISDGTVDRHGDTINPDGWDLSDYKKSPVVLWNHDPGELPVGKAKRVWVEDGKLKADVEFATEDLNPFGAQVGKMVAAGFLKATSVGFKPLEYKVAEDRADKNSYFPPVDFTKQSLMEFSIVSIPANPNAVLEAKAAGLPVDAITLMCEHWLERHKGAGLWMPREQVEALRSALVPAKIFSIPDLKVAAVPETLPVVAPAVKDLGEDEIKQLIRVHVEALRIKTTGKLD